MGVPDPPDNAVSVITSVMFVALAVSPNIANTKALALALSSIAAITSASVDVGLTPSSLTVTVITLPATTTEISAVLAAALTIAIEGAVPPCTFLQIQFHLYPLLQITN